MNKVDQYYRAFKEYRKETKNDNRCKEDRLFLKENNSEEDLFTTSKFVCEIKEDWIEAIEKGIPFIEKAIAEERQFIRVNGEIIPIEKVRKISKNSVEHLAKHSEMITHVQEDSDDIIPDKLYITEKLSDYAVYENRFLYMLLDYLDKFISLRIDEIEKTHSKYLGSFYVHKEVKLKQHEYSFETKFQDELKNNPFSACDEKCLQLIERIKNCQQQVNAFLRTDLMAQVSKSPMIKPPITKTNVLKMNNSFKNCVALYEYVSSYEGKGFEINEIKKEFNPFSDEFSDEIYDAIYLLMYLTYINGNEIKNLLENNYKEEEQRRSEEEQRKLQERIERMRQHARESNITMEEYMLLLEKRNQALLKDSEDLVRARNEILLLNQKIEDLNQEIIRHQDKIRELQGVIEDKIREIAYLNQKYIDDMAALKKQHQEEIALLNQKHQEEIESINQQHALEIQNLKTQHAEEIDQIYKEHYEEINRMKTEHQDELDQKESEYLEQRQILIDQYEAKMENLNLASERRLASYIETNKNLKSQLEELTKDRDERINAYEEKLKSTIDSYKSIISENDEKSSTRINELEVQNSDLSYKYQMFKSELDALRIKNGMMGPSEELTSRERFVELEEEYKVFDEFFQKQWKMTKKAIRKEILGKKK